MNWLLINCFHQQLFSSLVMEDLCARTDTCKLSEIHFSYSKLKFHFLRLYLYFAEYLKENTIELFKSCRDIKTKPVKSVLIKQALILHKDMSFLNMTNINTCVLWINCFYSTVVIVRGGRSMQIQVAKQLEVKYLRQMRRCFFELYVCCSCNFNHAGLIHPEKRIRSDWEACSDLYCMFYF